METLMAVAAKIEILMASIAVALLITTIALRGMFRAVRAAGAAAPQAVAAHQNALQACTGSQEFALAPARAGQRQVSLRAR